MWCECVLIISLSRKINFQTRHFNLDGTRHDGNIKLSRFTKVHYTSSKVSTVYSLHLSVVSVNTRETRIVRCSSYLYAIPTLKLQLQIKTQGISGIGCNVQSRLNQHFVLKFFQTVPILSAVSPLYFITCFTAGMEHFPSETNLENPAISMQILSKFPFYHTLEIFSSSN